LHQARVCLSLARFTDNVNVSRRLQELAMSFAARIGGNDKSGDLTACNCNYAQRTKEDANPPK
jgi:hypothetical protein